MKTRMHDNYFHELCTSGPIFWRRLKSIRVQPVFVGRGGGGGLSGSSLTSRLEDGGPTPVLTLKRSGAFFEPANRIRSSNWESMFWKQENESLSGSIVTRVSLRVQRRLLRTILSNWQGCGEFRTNRPPPSCSFALPHLRCNPTYRLILLLMVAFGRVFLLSGRA